MAIQDYKSAMTQQKFAVVIPRFEGHIHSHALDEVAETVNYGLQHLGHDSVLDGYEDQERRQIIIGAHLLGDQLASAPPGTIIYNLEQTDAPWVPQYAPLFRDFTLWDYSARNIEFWAQRDIKAIHVPIGYVSEMTRIQSAKEQDIDVLFYGFPNERREKVILELIQRRLNIAVLEGTYGAERDECIARAKVVLNMHFYEPGIFEIARVSYLLANKKYVISESSIDVPYGLKDAVEFTDYTELAEFCAIRVVDNYQRKACAENGFELFKKFDERDILKKALEASL
jgi:hypothetical protein